MAPQKIVTLLIVLGIIIAGIFYLDSLKVDRLGSGSEPIVQNLPRGEKSKTYDIAKEITTPDFFLNTDDNSITIQQQISKKVVLIDFWTYSCINCQRTIPYLNDWYEKYKDDGLEIIGIHTPEFEFEKKYKNVAEAVERFGIKYPVVMDNDYSTWTAYENRYWPRKYLIDIDGYIVYDHIGEGAYGITEAKIQELLRERKKVLGESGSISESIKAEDKNLTPRAESPETYFGAARNQNFGSGIPGVTGTKTFEVPKVVSRNTLYLQGEWDIKPEYAANTSVGARMIFRYKAKNVYFVGSSVKGARMRVLIDGKLVSEDLRGEDVAADGTMNVHDDRLYKIIEGDSVNEHTLELQVENAGLEAFTFTFG